MVRYTCLSIIIHSMYITHLCFTVYFRSNYVRCGAFWFGLLVCVFYLFTAPVQLFNQPIDWPSVRPSVPPSVYFQPFVRAFGRPSIVLPSARHSVRSCVRSFVVSSCVHSFFRFFLRSFGSLVFSSLPIFMFYFFSLALQEKSNPSGHHNKVHYTLSN